MSLFSWLFGRRPTTVAPPAAVARAAPATPVPVRRAPKLDFSIGDRFVRIAALDFFGQYSRSPDGTWVIAWRDGNDAGTRGGHRLDGPGRFYLFQNGDLVAQGRAERPNDGKVANDGSFIINDWRFASELNGTFYAYRSDGSLILKRDFAANLVNNGIADDASFAVCQCANAPHSADSSILTIFDLRSGQQIAAWVPDSGWADHYSFPVDDTSIRLHYRGGESFAYALDGNFIDRGAWIDSLARNGSGYVLHHVLREYGDAIPNELAKRILVGLTTTANDPMQHAMALKVRGLCQEALDDPHDALESYDAAIAIDPKIGLKRRAAALRRRIS
ncbi:tetratricopeptide repeat protein [Sphingomonadaceae bacterium G21617-S1]|nr:tetratricopeptide repeat protein [Sphingomonadaceae bacterium G21617-S1]